MALNPEELKELPESFIKIYQELEDFIIEDISRRIAKVGRLTDSAKLETIRANEIGISLNLIKKKVSEILNLTDEKVNQIFNDASLYSIAQENALYSTAGLNTVMMTDNIVLESIVNAAIKQTSGNLYNLTQSMGFAQKVNGKVVYKPIAKYYQDAMDLAVMQIKSGVTSYNTAIKQAVDRLCDSGIRYVDYDSGVVNRIDVAVRRAIMTGANQMTQKLTIKCMEEVGNDFVETTAHVGARPDHTLWQGKVFCFSGKSQEYPSFKESTGYGTGPGLGGWNCRHSFYPFIPKISTRAYTNKQLKNIDPPPFIYNGKEYTYYEASQYQRYIERKIRKTKSQLVGYESAGLKEEFNNASIRLKQQEKYYKEFSRAANIPIEKDRLQMYKFNKSISQKAVWANKKVELEANKLYNLGNIKDNVKAYIRDKPIRDILLTNNIEFIESINEKESIIKNYNPKIKEVSYHAKENQRTKVDRALMTLDKAQEFINNAKLVLYDNNRRTIKFMAQDGYSVMNFDNKLITAVPQKWRNKYNKYLKEE